MKLFELIRASGVKTAVLAVAAAFSISASSFVSCFSAFGGGKDIEGKDLTRQSKIGYVDGELTTVGDIADFGQGSGGADTNAVRELIYASFDGGTQKVNRVTGSFDGVSNRVDNIVRDLPGISNRLDSIEGDIPGISNRVDSLESATNNLASLVSGLTSQTNTWNAKYDKPVDGIATNDLAESVRTSLGKADTALQSSDIVNTTSSQATDKALSANIGRELQDQITNLKQRGRYLSVWNSVTGLAETSPTVTPYIYKAGDYFIVGVVSTNEATARVNYRPVGTNYVASIPSTAVETNKVIVNDTYYYDGTTWTLLHTDQKEITFSGITGSPYDNTALAEALNGCVTNVCTNGVSIVADKVADIYSPVKAIAESASVTNAGSVTAAAEMTNNITFAQLKSKPNTISGYGITDAYTIDDLNRKDTTLGFGMWSSYGQARISTIPSIVLGKNGFVLQGNDSRLYLEDGFRSIEDITSEMNLVEYISSDSVTNAGAVAAAAAYTDEKIGSMKSDRIATTNGLSTIHADGSWVTRTNATAGVSFTNALCTVAAAQAKADAARDEAVAEMTSITNSFRGKYDLDVYDPDSTRYGINYWMYGNERLDWYSQGSCWMRTPSGNMVYYTGHTNEFWFSGSGSNVTFFGESATVHGKSMIATRIKLCKDTEAQALADAAKAASLPIDGTKPMTGMLTLSQYGVCISDGGYITPIVIYPGEYCNKTVAKLTQNGYDSPIATIGDLPTPETEAFANAFAAKQDALPYPTNAIPASAISGLPTPDYTTNNTTLVSTITNLAPSKTATETAIENLSATSATHTASIATKIDAPAATNAAVAVSASLYTADDWIAVTNNTSKTALKRDIVPQVQSDWNETNTASKAYIQNKPTIVPVSGGSYTGEVDVVDSENDSKLRLRANRIDVSVTNEEARVKVKNSTTETAASIVAGDPDAYLSLSGVGGGIDIYNTGKVSTAKGGEIWIPMDKNGQFALTNDFSKENSVFSNAVSAVVEPVATNAADAIAIANNVSNTVYNTGAYFEVGQEGLDLVKSNQLVFSSEYELTNLVASATIKLYSGRTAFVIVEGANTNLTIDLKFPTNAQKMGDAMLRISAATNGVIETLKLNGTTLSDAQLKGCKSDDWKFVAGDHLYTFDKTVVTNGVAEVWVGHVKSER